MEVQKVLSMTGGEGETSYAMNSGLQKAVISKVKPFVQDTVKYLYSKTLPKRLTVADLGCSSGPNSLLVISEIIEAIHSIRQDLGHTSPEVQVLLNDLPSNDFNTVFKSIPRFLNKLREEMGDEFGSCFVSGVPGSFYQRLFPAGTIDFVHSSYSLQILSQVPLGIQNKGHIYLTTGSPPSLIEAYFAQFQKDFTMFLVSRCQEVVLGGRMVITIIGRRSSDPTSKECCHVWELVAKSFRDMVTEGKLEAAKLDSFNWPGYYASPEEVRNIIQEQGSFHLDLLETFDVDWDVNNQVQNNCTSGRYVSRYMRAVMESLIATHFGEEIVEDVFEKFAENVNTYLAMEKGKVVNLVMCMTKKG